MISEVKRCVGSSCFVIINSERTKYRVIALMYCPCHSGHCLWEVHINPCSVQENAGPALSYGECWPSNYRGRGSKFSLVGQKSIGSCSVTKIFYILCHKCSIKFIMQPSSCTEQWQKTKDITIALILLPLAHAKQLTNHLQSSPFQLPLSRTNENASGMIYEHGLVGVHQLENRGEVLWKLA